MFKKFSSALCALLLLSGCAHKQHMLKPIKKEKAHFVQEQENVELRLRVLTRQHCQKQLYSAPYACTKVNILHGTIINNGNCSLTFSHSNTNLALLTQQEVCDYLKKRAGVLRGAIIGLAVATGPLLLCLATAAIIPGALTLESATGALAFCSFILAFYGTIPIIAISVPTSCLLEYNQNRKISQEIRKKIPEKITVAPDSTQNFLLFAHALPSHFTITLTREQQEPLVFNVQIPDTCLCTNKSKNNKKQMEKKHDS